ncbi:MAG: hypothetical protein U0175_12720 [Caldilineaceae bacterium]
MSDQAQSAFTTALEETLNHFREPLWLGEHSPFASPYFLGQALPAQATSSSERGEILRQVLLELLNKLDGKNAEYYRRLLWLYFVDGIPPGKLLEILAIGRTKLSEDRRRALTLLAEQLIQFAHPALRLETVPKISSWVARDEAMESCVSLLLQQKSVALVGGAGVGKTTLAAKIADELRYIRKTPCFWYTIRPNLNDQVESFAFAFGLFAKQLGVPSLWLELTATHGKAASELKREKVLELVRYVLDKLHPAPLLCIDEIDLLDTCVEAKALVGFIESLRAWTPMLLIGQSVPMFYDHVETLEGLDEDSFVDLLEDQPLTLSASQQQQLFRITQGNPRLALLFCNTIKAGEIIDDLLAAFRKAPLLETLFDRILQRLTQAELNLLLEIAIFRLPAPIQHWQQAETNHLLATLLSKQLLRSDEQDGVEVPAVYRSILLQRLNTAQKQIFHQQAAIICSSYALYTETAYHLFQTERLNEGFLLWNEYKQLEIDQGQAVVALRLFRSLDSGQLKPDVRQEFQLACGNLEFLTGRTPQALADVEPLLQKTSLVAIRANELAGRIHNDQDEFELPVTILMKFD